MGNLGDLLPAATTTLANTKVYSQPFFNNLIPFGYFEIGVIVASALIIFLIVIFKQTILNFISRLRTSDLKYGDFSAQHRDTQATQKAIMEHRRFKGILNGGNKISRYD